MDITYERQARAHLGQVWGLFQAMFVHLPNGRSQLLSAVFDKLIGLETLPGRLCLRIGVAGIDVVCDGEFGYKPPHKMHKVHIWSTDWKLNYFRRSTWIPSDNNMICLIELAKLICKKA